MQIFLHKLDGSQSVVQIENQITVEQLFENESICGNRLVNQGSVLHSDFDLSTLSANANVYVTDGLDGGKKKKKKKVYTTKKKGKHIHKKIKMLPFTLYSVDGTFFANFRKRKRHPGQKDLSFLRTRNLHGPALG